MDGRASWSLCAHRSYRRLPLVENASNSYYISSRDTPKRPDVDVYGFESLSPSHLIRRKRMLRRLKTALLIMFATTATAGAMGAQTISGNCAPKDTTSARLIAKFTSIVTAATLAAKVERSELGLDNVTPSQILLVTDKTICAKAAVAMDAHRAQNSARHKLYVLTLGTSYGVLDNTIVANQYTVAYVFDRSWKYVSNQTF